MKFHLYIPFVIFLLLQSTVTVYAQTRALPSASPTIEASQSATPEPTVEPTASPEPRVDITKETEESVGPLGAALNNQDPGRPFLNPIKHAIRASVDAGVPANTLVLLLLLPVIAALIAATRHIVGLRGFGIFFPAALAVVFLAIGPVLGITLFSSIVLFSTLARMTIRRLKMKLQYLPKMALTLWAVVIGVLGILFLAPIIRHPDLTNVSIFPVLILTLLAEDFSKVQAGKSARTAIDKAFETIILALASYLILILESVRVFAITNPEILLISVAAINYLVGKYVGLRFLEYWRFRKLINS